MIELFNNSHSIIYLMRRYLLSILFLFTPLFAQSIRATYDVSFGVFGEIGKSEITYVQDKDEYLISVHAWTTGLTAVLTQNREEEYISQGKIIKGVLRPDIFVKFRKSDQLSKISLFRFEHKKRKIVEYQTKSREIHSTKYDVHTMKNVDQVKKEYDYSKSPFRLYTQNDLLSLFFNTQKILPTLQSGENRHYTAVGSKTDDCIIDIAVPDTKLRSELEMIMPDNNGLFITIIINQDIFQSKNGELHVNFDKDGFAKDVVLKDVIMFGDIRGKRTNQETNFAENLSTICL